MKTQQFLRHYHGILNVFIILRLSLKIPEFFCHYSKLDCSQVSDLYQAVFNPNVVRVGAVAYVSSAFAIKWIDKGAFPALTFIQLTALISSSYYSEYQEKKFENVKTQVSGFLQNHQDLQLDKIVQAMHNLSQIDKVDMRVYLEPAVTIISIGLNSAMGFLNSFTAQEIREQKLKELEIRKTKMVERVNESENIDAYKAETSRLNIGNDIKLIDEFIAFLTLEIDNHAIFSTYSPLLFGSALIGLQTAKAYITRYHAIEEEKEILSNLQKLMKFFPEGILNNYFDCSKFFEENASVMNEKIIELVADNKCALRKQTDDVCDLLADIIIDPTNIAGLVQECQSATAG
jgi:hypothetical protein